MDRAIAIENLNSIEGARSRTRTMLDDGWFALVVWGVIVLASAPFTQLAGGDAVGFYWMAAGALGIFVTFRYFRARELEIGLVSRHKSAYIVLALSMAIGSMALGIAGGGGMLSAYGPVLVIAAGLAAFAALDRSLLLACSASLMALLGIAILAGEPERATLWAAVGEGAILLITGLAAMRRTQA
jgi:hypothetical protein